MTRFFSISWFHLRLYTKNSYFVWLPINSTLSFFLIQYLAAYASQQLDSSQLWLRAGIFGLWSSATTAAGSIDFQRFQGTLLYLINQPIGDYWSLAALLVPASTFGLLAFPLSAALAFCFGLPVSVTPYQFLGIFCFWSGALILDFVVAAFFVLTRNFSAYEDLIFVPVLLLSGFLTPPPWLEPFRSLFDWVLPIGAATRLILLTDVSLWKFYLLQFIVSCALSLTAAYVLCKRLLAKAYQNGEWGD